MCVFLVKVGVFSLLCLCLDVVFFVYNLVGFPKDMHLCRRVCFCPVCMLCVLICSLVISLVVVWVSAFGGFVRLVAPLLVVFALLIFFSALVVRFFLILLFLCFRLSLLFFWLVCTVVVRFFCALQAFAALFGFLWRFFVGVRLCVFRARPILFVLCGWPSGVVASAVAF